MGERGFEFSSPGEAPTKTPVCDSLNPCSDACMYQTQVKVQYL